MLRCNPVKSCSDISCWVPFSDRLTIGDRSWPPDMSSQFDVRLPQIFRRNTRFAGTVIRPDYQFLSRFGDLILVLQHHYIDDYVPVWRVSLWRVSLWRASVWRVPVWRVSLWRGPSSARFTLARCQFGAFHFGAFPIFVSMLIQYGRQFSLFSAKASLARVAYLFVHMFPFLFPFCACFLRRSVVYASLPRSHSTRPTLARVSLSAYFSFLYASHCLRHIFINDLNASSCYSIANLFIAGVFCVSGPYFY